MGWFLSRKSGRKKPKARKSARPPTPWDPRKTLAALQVLGAAGLLLGVGVGWHQAEDALVSYVDARQARVLRPEQVELAGATHWMSRTLRAQLRTLVANQTSGNPLDNQGLQAAARALSDNPWVERVQRVERRPDGTVAVTALYREPVALVECDAGYRLVDGQAVVLPGIYGREKYTRQSVQKVGLPVIVGAAEQPHREGQVWPGKDVKAGLSLVKLLQGEPYLAQVEAFDVGQRDKDDRIRLTLKTAAGLVRWGFPPGEERRLEQDAATKKQWLTTVYKNRGSIDAGGKIVDVYGADIFIRQPEPEEPDVTLGYTWSR